VRGHVAEVIKQPQSGVLEEFDPYHRTAASVTHDKMIANLDVWPVRHVLQRGKSGGFGLRYEAQRCWARGMLVKYARFRRRLPHASLSIVRPDGWQSDDHI
jgi:hypothetical protein